MRTLDLFCGTKSFSKVALEFGYEIHTLDILQKFNPTFCCDLMTWDYKQFPKGHYDIIWASPNCKDYSVLNRISQRGKNMKDLTLSNTLIKRVLEIIEWFEPKYWYLENPQTGTLKDQIFMLELPYTDVDYCKYGYNYRKRTRIWTNSNYNGKVLCKVGTYCDNKKEFGKHIESVKFTKTWTQRISIPRDLIVDILNQVTD